MVEICIFIFWEIEASRFLKKYFRQVQTGITVGSGDWSDSLSLISSKRFCYSLPLTLDETLLMIYKIFSRLYRNTGCLDLLVLDTQELLQLSQCLIFRVNALWIWRKESVKTRASRAPSLSQQLPAGVNAT